MTALGALSQAWTSAEASLPLGWQISGIYRFDELWIALGEGPAFDDYLSGSGRYAEQALRRLSDRCASGEGRRMADWRPKFILAGIALWLSACGAGASSSQATHSAAEHSEGTPTESAAPTLAATFEETGPFADPPAGSIEILMTFGPKFEPEEATAKAGTVTFFLRNDKGDGPPAAHNFLLGAAVDAPALATSPLMGSGEAGILTIEDLAPGTYAYWCTIPSPDGAPHSQYGMVGTLTVTP